PKTSSDAGENEEAISRNIKIGLSGKVFDRLLLALDIDKNFEREAKFHFGTEYSPWDVLSIRAGYDQGLGPALGFGLKKWGLGLDYAWLGHDYEAVHRVSVNFKFGQEREKMSIWEGKDEGPLPVIDEVSLPVPLYTIAVADFKALKEASLDEAREVSNLLCDELVNSEFKVLERRRMKDILDEQGFQLTDCIDKACAVKMGKTLGVQKMIIGDVSRISDRIFVSIQ
ncbi:MAG: CsgG/HfaB family protein, partial [bacterium]|nr:CsgG/HfaB family protein [bacterium]